MRQHVKYGDDVVMAELKEVAVELNRQLGEAIKWIRHWEHIKRNLTGKISKNAIAINTLSGNEVDNVQYSIYARNHFKERLLQRYNISITDKEYQQLCEKKIEKIYGLSSSVVFAELEINGLRFWVTFNKKLRTLGTVLNKEGYLPVPLKYRRLGITAQQFNERLQNEYLKVIQVKQWLFESECNAKILFTKNPLNMPDHINKLGYVSYLKGVIYSETFIHGLF